MVKYVWCEAEAEAVVGGPSEVHIEEGSQMALECWVKQAPVPPVYIFWYHNNTMVNYARQHHLQVTLACTMTPSQLDTSYLIVLSLRVVVTRCVPGHEINHNVIIYLLFIYVLDKHCKNLS